MVGVCKAAGRPLPQLHEDDVLDFQITEAMVVRAAMDQKKMDAAREREEWRSEHKNANLPGAPAGGAPQRRMK